MDIVFFKAFFNHKQCNFDIWTTTGQYTADSQISCSSSPPHYMLKLIIQYLEYSKYVY